jgi:uncharacterized protein (DUF4415 family)
MKKELTEQQRQELEALALLADHDIDVSDAPASDEWDGAVVGRFYRPAKRSVTIRLDADLLDWLKQDGRGYQTRVNAILRDAMRKQKQSRKAA